MSFPDSDTIATVEALRLEPIESEHHNDCPQHPWNNVYDDADPCECEQLYLDDAAEQGDAKNDEARGA